MKKYFKTIDGKIYLDITPKAKELFGILDLYSLWQKGNITYRLPMIDEAELNFMLTQENKSICIEIGKDSDIKHL
jgi:hypothetical protein